MKKLEVLPALDIKGGQAVRLLRGELIEANIYDDPTVIASEFVSSGAEWIHLVDLDAAYGQGDNKELLKVIINNNVNIKIQLSGGIRDSRTLDQALQTGCIRANISTTALADLNWVESVIKKHGNQISIGLDLNGKRLTPRGGDEIQLNLTEVIKRLDDAGCSRYVITDVDRDGALSGPNLELLHELLELTKTPIIASGGVASLSDISDLSRLVALGIEGVIIGKALHSGAFTLEQAIKAGAGF